MQHGKQENHYFRDLKDKLNLLIPLGSIIAGDSIDDDEWVCQSDDCLLQCSVSIHEDTNKFCVEIINSENTRKYECFEMNQLQEVIQEVLEFKSKYIKT